jgi:23S rRNA pseudouridine2605 synthase
MTKSAKKNSFGGERIAKVIARAGLCSRREAEAWIVAGRVAVNGTVISSPAFNVTARDRIAVDGRPLPARERTRLFLFHKPAGLVTTSSDPQGRPTIFSVLPKNLPRLVSVGRLDLNTEGLLLLTNDGGLARTLELPDTGWLRRYRVRAHGRVTQSDLDRLRQGITVDGIRYGPIEASLDHAQTAKSANIWLTFAMREGKNREVKNVLAVLGLQVNRLIRVSFGPFQLGELATGAVEEVHTRTLREQLGERLAAIAGADFSSPIMERETPEHSESRSQKSLTNSEVPAEARKARTGDLRIRSHRHRDKRRVDIVDSGPRASARSRKAKKKWRPR